MIDTKKCAEQSNSPAILGLSHMLGRYALDSSIRGYSVVIYNTKIICIKKFIKVRIYTCVANKNIYMGNTVLKRLYKIN